MHGKASSHIKDLCSYHAPTVSLAKNLDYVIPI